MLVLITFGFLAGIATTLSPCILPILPIMLSGSVGGKDRPYGIVSGFILSFALFTVFLGSIINSFAISADTLRLVAATLLVLMGLVMVLPALSHAFNNWASRLQGKFAGGGKAELKTGFWGGFLTGAPLGLIWVPCTGPILTAVLSLALTQTVSFGLLAITLAYSLGVGLVMLLIAILGRQIIGSVRWLSARSEAIHRFFGLLVVLAGVGIIFGWDKELQLWILERIPLEWSEQLQSIERSSTIEQELKNLR